MVLALRAGCPTLDMFMCCFLFLVFIPEVWPLLRGAGGNITRSLLRDVRFKGSREAWKGPNVCPGELHPQPRGRWGGSQAGVRAGWPRQGTGGNTQPRGRGRKRSVNEQGV